MPRSAARRSVVAAVAGALVTSTMVVPAAAATASPADAVTQSAVTRSAVAPSARTQPVRTAAAGGVRWVKWNRAALTKTASSRSRTVARPDAGTRLRVLDRGRYRLQVRTPAGKVGWVSKKAVTQVRLKDVSGTRYTRGKVTLTKDIGSRSTKVTQARLGTRVTVLARTTGRENNRVKVRVPGGRTGWISTSRISKRDVWGQLARCESGGNPRTNTGNGFYGLYQFTGRTWHAVGGQGLPHRHSKGEQTKRAQILQDRAGWGQWPHCTRKLGLR
ncbi:transglycosylase family protein [Isoptericola sp. NPDC019693]|uniref:transglycosylase family protein n=1 Tax=Isoptericola sp. NPDC019693 TaxID=3364009 RepID=UPI0037A1528D